MAFNLLFLSLPLRTMRLAKYPLLRHIGYSEFPTANVGWRLSIGSIFLSFQGTRKGLLGIPSAFIP